MLRLASELYGILLITSTNARRQSGNSTKTLPNDNYYV